MIGRRTGSSYTSDLSREGHREAGGVGHRAGRDHHRGSARRAARSRRAGVDRRRSGALLRGRGDAGDRSARSPAPGAPRRPRWTADPRIVNSEGASFETHVGRHIFANSRGFAGEYRSSYCSLSVRRWRARANPWSATTGTPRRADSPAWNRPSRWAARRRARALRRLNPVKVPTQKVPGGVRAAHGAHAARQSVRGGARRCRSTGTNRFWRASWARRWPART